MNGTTAVPIPSQAIGKFFRINSARGAMVTPNPAVTQTNVGTITIRALGGGIVYAVIPPGVGVAQQSIYTVPVRSLLKIRSIEIQALSSAGGTARGFDAQLIFRNASGFFTAARKLQTTDTHPDALSAETGIPVPARTDFWVKCTYVSNAPATVTASWEGHLHQLLTT
jgi:hypothetical protein